MTTGARGRLTTVSQRRLHLHVGASKTGTSALQRGLWRSVDALGAAGVGLPLVGRRAHVDQVLRPLGWVASEGYVGRIRKRRLRKLVPLLESTPGDSLLVSNEDLAELDEERIALLNQVARDAGLDLSVVITARTWARQVPSEYQQFLKHRLTTDYQTWLAEVRDRRGPSAHHFWLRQDFAGMAERWAAEISADRVHVLVSPSRPLDAGTRQFCQIVGIPADAIDVPTHRINASFGAVEAEVYRRLNGALPPAFDDYEADYYPGVRIPIVSGLLPREASARLPLPDEHLGWVTEECQRQLERLRAGGYQLHGQPELLLPGPDASGPMPEVDEVEVSQAAIAALARMFARSHRSAS